MARGPLVLNGRNFDLRFEHQGDRWQHAVVFRVADIEGQVARPGDRKRVVEVPWILQSIEGQPDETWPASPPWQEVRIEQLTASSRVLLAVGMAGSSHWSLAAQFDAAGEALHFDVACRLHQQPQWLGSRYRLTDSMAIDFIAGFATTLTIKGHSVSLEPGDSSPTPPATLRWQYRVGSVSIAHGEP